VGATQPRRREPVYALGEHTLAYGMRAYFRWHLDGLEYIPKDTAALVASNHLSYLDGLAVAYGVHRAGRRPRFLTKAGLFKVPVIGAALRAIGQIPVNRGTRDAPQSLDNAAGALAAGEVVVVFPEGTTSTAPDLAMGKAKTGTARLALQTGMDVIPCATWGGQWVWTKHLGVHLRPRQDIWVRFGPPISFHEYEGRETEREAWRGVSDRIMAEIAGLLADLKQAKPWTPREPTRKKFIAEQDAKKAAAEATEVQAEAMESEGGPPDPPEAPPEGTSAL
jgi:1-acyl-sn-glycerol-3-phosphate acyltransferase